MSQKKILPIAAVLFSFVVMSFVDMVGVATDYVKADLQLSDGVVQFISSAAFLWFFIISVPTGLLQARFGKRNVLVTGIILSAIGLLFPFLNYTYFSVLIGFSLLGIGNTIIQVAANPLLILIVNKEKASGFMSFSQFIKAIGSMMAAPLTALVLVKTGDWKLVFLFFAIVSVLAALLLYSVQIKETNENKNSTTFASCFKLLNNRFVFLMALAIFLLVGIDVGINTVSGQFLIEKFGFEQSVAASGRSLYFMGKLIGSLLGAILLTKFNPRQFLNITNLLLCVSILVFALNPFNMASWALLFIIGFFAANIFPLIFTLAVESLPKKANEISGLLMMAISGGAIIPPLMGAIAGASNYTMSLFLLLGCGIVIVMIGLMNKPKNNIENEL
jgi:fucose permease